VTDGQLDFVSGPPWPHDQIFVKLFKIDRWLCSQKDGGGQGEWGGLPGLVGRPAVAGTEGPGVVSPGALLDAVSSSDLVQITVCFL
jgi:hypothetical protein